MKKKRQNIYKGIFMSFLLHKEVQLLLEELELVLKKKQQILLQTEWPIEFLHVVYLMRITRLIAITQKKELLYL